MTKLYHMNLSFKFQCNGVKANLFIILTLFNYLAIGQGNLLKKVTITDVNNNPIPFVHAVLMEGDFQTMTNEDGNCSLNISNTQNTVVFTHVQYRDTLIALNELINGQKIILKKEVNLIDEISIYGNDEYAYNLVKKARKKLMRSNSHQISKTYLELYTVCNNQPVELIRALYNTNFSGPKIEDLSLKSGKLALAKEQGGHFISLSTAKLILGLNLSRKSERTPINPLQLYRAKRKFSFSRLTPKTSQIAHIRFNPKKDNGKYFSGEIWIDSKSFTIKKLLLQIDDSKLFPLRPIHPDDTLENIKMEIAYTMDSNEDNYSLKHIVVQYYFDYLNPDKSRPPLRKIKSKAILYPYEKGKHFFEPRIDYSDHHTDYKKISFIPYDTLLWQNNAVFDLSNDLREKLEYFKKHGQFIEFHEGNTDFSFSSQEKNTIPFFEHNNVYWKADQRWTLTPSQWSIRNIEEIPRTSIAYNIYLDAIEIAEKKFHFNTYSYIDVYKTKFFLSSEDKTSIAYINILFDIVEIHRRILIQKLETATTKDEISNIYLEIKSTCEKVIKKYNREVYFGQNIDNMLGWSDYVKGELGIDNFKYFGIGKI